MKTLVLIVVVLLAGSSGLELKDQGQSCGKSPTYTISSFNINPWPIYPAQEYSVTMSGIFTANETVDQIYIATKKDYGLWQYSYVDVKTKFQKNQSKTFVFSVQGPSFKGSYINQITLHRIDFSSLSCWEYTYIINS